MALTALKKLEASADEIGDLCNPLFFFATHFFCHYFEISFNFDIFFSFRETKKPNSIALEWFVNAIRTAKTAKGVNTFLLLVLYIECCRTTDPDYSDTTYRLSWILSCCFSHLLQLVWIHQSWRREKPHVTRRFFQSSNIKAACRQFGILHLLWFFYSWRISPDFGTTKLTDPLPLLQAPETHTQTFQPAGLKKFTRFISDNKL